MSSICNYLTGGSSQHFLSHIIYCLRLVSNLILLILERSQEIKINKKNLSIHITDMSHLPDATVGWIFCCLRSRRPDQTVQNFKQLFQPDGFITGRAWAILELVLWIYEYEFYKETFLESKHCIIIFLLPDWTDSYQNLSVNPVSGILWLVN